MFDELFAVSSDDRAVRFSYSNPGWRPMTPTKWLARKVTHDTSLVQLDEVQVERVLEYIDPPRNFSLEWRVRERWGGWMSVVLLLSPSIVLWVVREDFLHWTGGYSEIAVGVVTIAQLSLLFGFRDILTEKIAKLAVRLDKGRWEDTAAGIPTEPSIQTDQRTNDLATERATSAKEPLEVASGSAVGKPNRPTETDMGEALEYATIALQSDAYSHQAKKELIEKFLLSAEQANETVQIAKERIMRDLEERNAEAWKTLGLPSYHSPESKADLHLDDLGEHGRMAGMDVSKLREAFKNVAPEEMRRLEARTEEVLARQRQLNEANSRAQSVETTHEPKGTWTVYVDDNCHYMDEEERYFLGSFDSYEAARAACQEIVDEFLEAGDAKSADELFDYYVSFGEDPWIKGPAPSSEQPPFSARDYARKRCHELRP